MMTNATQKKNKKVTNKSKSLRWCHHKAASDKDDIRFICPTKEQSNATTICGVKSSSSNWDNLKKVLAENAVKHVEKKNSLIRLSQSKHSSSEKSLEQKRSKRASRKQVQSETPMVQIGRRQHECEKSKPPEIRVEHPARNKRKADDFESRDKPVSKRQRVMFASKPAVTCAAVANKPDIWFDDVDPALLGNLSDDRADEESDNMDETEVSKGDQALDGAIRLKGKSLEQQLVKPSSFEGLTQCVAMDCEMVGAGTSNILARVSIVNIFGHCLYDTFVKPREPVTDYRTHVSGVRPQDLKDAPTFDEVQKQVFSIVDKRILVGHAIRNDLQVLFLSHPRNSIRDTSKYIEFKKLFNGRTPSLKKLTEKLLGVNIQSGEHNSIEDARAAMRLYTMYKLRWEKSLKSRKTKYTKGHNANVKDTS